MEDNFNILREEILMQKRFFYLLLVATVIFSSFSLVFADVNKAVESQTAVQVQVVEQVVLPDAKYKVSESIIKIKNNEQNIVGTLTLPENTEGPFPVVLILHGFTGQRNEMNITNSDETMFGKTARIFTEQGYATLRIDFIGSGESDGNWEDTTFSSQISDAEAALKYLMKHPSIDTDRIGILGLSQGGLVAACTASRNPIVKSTILWSPAANPISTYTQILGGNEVIQKGLNSNGEAVTGTLPWGAETKLKTPFFEDLYKINPIAEIASYKGSLQVVVGLKDTIVAPQPQSGELYLKYHNTQEGAEEELIKLDADHMLDILTENKLPFDTALFNGLKWLDKTLK